MGDSCLEHLEQADHLLGKEEFLLLSFVFEDDYEASLAANFDLMALNRHYFDVGTIAVSG